MTTAIILAAGPGTRLEPFTKTRPKPLIKIAGMPIVEHNLQSMYALVDRYVLVVGYLREQIESYFGNEYRGKPIHYVHQLQSTGTGQAVRLAAEYFSEKTIVIYGDDIYDPEMFAALPARDSAVVGKIHDKWQDYGVLRADNEGKLVDIVEKPKEFVGNIVNVGIYQFTQTLLPYLERMTLSVRGEYELTEAVTYFAAEHEMQVIGHEGYWLSVGYPWHILLANKALLQRESQSGVLGTIEPNVVMKGNIEVGEGTVIRSGVYIDGSVKIGRNCVIGPNCYIRGNVTIGDDCRIGNAVEIEESVIGDKVNIEHLSFIGYSVLGSNIIIGGGTITADRRHDRDVIQVNIKEELKNTGLYHLGAFIGDMVRTGIHTSIYPGRKLHYHSYTLPGEIVKQDKLSSEHIRLK